MESTIIYHNPRCSKSREALGLLEEKGVSFKIKEYLKDGISESEVLELVALLGDEAGKIVRVKEDDFKDHPFSLEDHNLVASQLAKNPKLLERPIVVHGGRAKIGRPPECVLTLF